MGDFVFIKSEDDYATFSEKISSRMGITNPTIRNRPTSFPVFATFCLTNDLNGLSAFIKHISLEEIKKTLTDAEI